MDSADFNVYSDSQTVASRDTDNDITPADVNPEPIGYVDMVMESLKRADEGPLFWVRDRNHCCGVCRDVS